MEFLKILQERENTLFNRKEVKVIVKSVINPSMKDALKFISEKFSKPEENIKINEIQGKFGRDTFLISSHVYHSKEDKERIVAKSKKEKKEEEKKS